jgi:NAD(P)-dependent dehydrogenase (short-subunit alcohol dehydrogenase family)
MGRSYVVMGGGHGIGRAIVERPLADAEDNAVGKLPTYWREL